MYSELKEVRQKLFDIDMKLQTEHNLDKRNELKKIKKNIYSEYKTLLLKMYLNERKEGNFNDKYKGR